MSEENKSTPAGLEAGQPRKDDGTFHAAAAATKAAYAASEGCETKADHETAADLHDEAARLHAAGGNAAMATQHKEKAAFHRDHATALTASAEGQPPADGNAGCYPLQAEAMTQIDAPEIFDGF